MRATTRVGRAAATVLLCAIVAGLAGCATPARRLSGASPDPSEMWSRARVVQPVSGVRLLGAVTPAVPRVQGLALRAGEVRLWEAGSGPDGAIQLGGNGSGVPSAGPRAGVEFDLAQDERALVACRLSTGGRMLIYGFSGAAAGQGQQTPVDAEFAVASDPASADGHVTLEFSQAFEDVWLYGCRVWAFRTP